jgi:hypothetical protein
MKGTSAGSDVVISMAICAFPSRTVSSKIPAIELSMTSHVGYYSYTDSYR